MTRKPTHTTRCGVCKRTIGAVQEYSLRKRKGQAKNAAWRVAQHRYRGAICIGSRVVVDPEQVIAEHHESGRVAANG